jgi:DNA-binding response OmpR family regulator
MKKILIIEDDEILANIYRNKLAVEHYQVEVSRSGESGLALMRSFKPHMILLDLMLPQMHGVDVIRNVRSEEDFAKLPIVVFSNTYLTNVIQEAWKAGATKCLPKARCSPRDVLDVVRQTVGNPDGVQSAGSAFRSAQSPVLDSSSDAAFLSELQKTFIETLPPTLTALLSSVQQLSRSTDDVGRLKCIYDLHRRAHALSGNAGVAGLYLIGQMAAALEALLKELYDKPKNINVSSLHTVAAAVDFLAFLFKSGLAPEKQEMPPANILVVDDEAISRRAIIYALEKTQLPSIGVEQPNEALQMLVQKSFDLVFLDVDMPEMTGFELCAKLRELPHHKKTPVLFVTALNDFESRASSSMAGGNDFIGKPFLFIELTVKALMHVLRVKLQPRLNGN